MYPSHTAHTSSHTLPAFFESLKILAACTICLCESLGLNMWYPKGCIVSLSSLAHCAWISKIKNSGTLHHGYRDLRGSKEEEIGMYDSTWKGYILHCIFC